MKLRDALMNLAITAALVLVIALVAVVLKRSRSPTPRAIPVNAPVGVSYDQGSRPVLEIFEVLNKAEFVETRANEADTLRFRVGQEEFIFVLYFIDALESTPTHPQRVRDQSNWFGGASEKQIIEAGAEALEYVRGLLASKPFLVLTRWERVPNSMRYYALIRVEIEPGRQVYLADLLMRAGYARIGGVTTHLPSDSRSQTDYLLDLKKLGDQARAAKAGIWSKVR